MSDDNLQGSTLEGRIEKMTVRDTAMSPDEVEAHSSAETEGWYETPNGDLVHIVSYEGRVWVNGREFAPVENPHERRVVAEPAED